MSLILRLLNTSKKEQKQKLRAKINEINRKLLEITPKKKNRPRPEIGSSLQKGMNALKIKSNHSTPDKMETEESSQATVGKFNVFSRNHGTYSGTIDERVQEEWQWAGFELKYLSKNSKVKILINK